MRTSPVISLLVLSIALSPALSHGEVRAVIPSFDEDERLCLLLLDHKGGKWTAKPYVLPRVQGREVNSVEFSKGRMILGSVLDKDAAEGNEMPWVSECVSTTSLFTSSGLNLESSVMADCPYNSKALERIESLLRIELQAIEEKLGHDAVTIPDLDSHALILHAMLGYSSRARIPFVLPARSADVDLNDDRPAAYSKLFLINMEDGTMKRVAGDVEGNATTYNSPTILHDRYLCYTEADFHRSVHLESKFAPELRPGIKGLRGGVYDAESGREIFRTEDSYLGVAPLLTPSINPQGTHVLWIHSDLPFQVEGTDAPHGYAGLSIYEIDGGRGERLTPVGTRVSTCSWLPDGRRFFYTLQEGRQGTVYLASIDGGSEKLNLTLTGVDSVGDAIRDHASRAWFPDGERFLAVARKGIGANDAKRPIYHVEVILTDMTNRTSTVVTSYDMVEARRLLGLGPRPYILP